MDNENLRGSAKFGFVAGATLSAEQQRTGRRIQADSVVSMTHTERKDQLRVISIRKALKHEARYYISQIAK